MYNYLKIFFLFLFSGLLAVSPLVAQQSADGIRTMLVARDRDIKALVGESDTLSQESKEQLRNVINEVIDFRAMGEGALGRHWSTLTEAQKDEFVDTFSKIVRTQSLANLDVYRADVSYDDITIAGSTAEVVTTTLFKDVPTKVIYELRFTGQEWLATDIILDEVSTVRGYARSFGSVIRKKGFDELMVKLREKLAEVEAEVEAEV